MPASLRPTRRRRRRPGWTGTTEPLFFSAAFPNRTTTTSVWCRASCQMARDAGVQPIPLRTAIPARVTTKAMGGGGRCPAELHDAASPVRRLQHLEGAAARQRPARPPREHRRTCVAKVEEPLPAPFDACDKQGTRVNSLSLVRYRTNDYSVPVAYGHQEVWIRGYVHEVVIGCGAGIIARHPRSYDREDGLRSDPLALLEPPWIRPAASRMGTADAFPTLRRLLEARMGKAGKREYVQVLRLLETFDLEVLHGAVKDAALGDRLRRVKHLVLCRSSDARPNSTWISIPTCLGPTWRPRPPPVI